MNTKSSESLQHNAGKRSGSFAIRHLSLVPAGFFLARVALEVAGRPWPGPLVVVVIVLGGLGGLALGRSLARRHVRLWPALLLLGYVLWPRRDLAMAAGVAVLSALVWLLGESLRFPLYSNGERHSLPRWGGAVADGVTFVIALVVYVATVAPDVLPADAGEFQLVAALLGVAHPPGFPLYTMVGHLFVRLFPWGTPAYRLNLMSALLAAGTLVLVARATRLWARRLGGTPLLIVASGLAAALALGTATTFWAQATIANVRTPAVFFTALTLCLLARFAGAASGPSAWPSRERGGPSEWPFGESGSREADKLLVLLGLVFGLAGCHYPPLAFVSIFFGIYVLLVDPRLVAQPRRWWRPVLAGLAGFLPLLYLPIRGAMDAPLAPEGLDTLDGFLHHFLAQGFAGDMFAFATPADLPHRLALVPTLFLFQFNILLLAGALVGLLGLLWRDWRLFVMLAGSLALHTFVSITYRAPQTVEYLMPAYVPVAIAVGLAPLILSLPRAPSEAGGSVAANPGVRATLGALLLWAGLLNGWAHGPSFVELAGDHTARQMAGPLLETAPTRALILADWRWVMPLRYLQEVEGVRPDVDVRYVYPVMGEEYREVWRARIGEAAPDVPVLLTHYYEFDEYTTEPWEMGFLIRPRPVAEPAAPLVPVGVTFGDHVRVVGYSLRQNRFHPGQVAEVVLAWQPTGSSEQAPSFTLRLLDGEGRSWAQVDRRLGADCAPGEVRFQRLALPLYPTLPPARYQVTLGAYTVTETGFENLVVTDGETTVGLAELELVPVGSELGSSVMKSAGAPFTLHRQAVPFHYEGGRGGTGTGRQGMQRASWLRRGWVRIVGVDYDRSVPDVLRVYLHWQGPTADQGSAGDGWQAQVRAADGVEAAARLAPVPKGAYQTVAVDLQGAAGDELWLSLTNEQGQVMTAAGPWGWPVDEIRLPAAASDARFVPLGDEMAVIGAKAHSAVPGETMAVDVELVSLRPLTSDDGTSVRVVDGDGRFAAHDCQPALGAIPTLKWIRGSRVVDRHLLPLPEDFAAQSGQATLVAYERFRMMPLPPMDGRFSQVPLGIWTGL